jgi:hypothetical protein
MTSATPPFYLLLLLWLGIATALLGVLLIRRGRFPRRRGTTPHCRGCDYDLTGIDATRCPECGRELTEKSIVRGERHRRPRLTVAGAILLLLGLGLCTVNVVARSPDVYRYKPTRWVIDDLRTPIAPRAWTELQRRMAESPLSDAQNARLADTILAVIAVPGASPPPAYVDYLEGRFPRLSPAQQDGYVAWLVARVRAPRYTFPTDVRTRLDRLVMANLLSPAQQLQIVEAALAEQGAAVDGAHRAWPIDYLADQAQAGRLTEAQNKRFVDQLCAVVLEVRPTVIAGESLPYNLKETGVGPSRGWWHRLAGRSLRLDGKQLPGYGGGSTSSSSFGGGSTGSWVPVEQPGRHMLELELTRQIYTGGNQQLDEKTSTLYHERTLKLSAPFEALAAAPPGYMKWIDDPSLKPAMTAAISFTEVHYPVWRKDDFEIMVNFRNPPANAAFDVIARVGGREYPLGTVTQQKGANGGIHVSQAPFQGGPVTAIDLILRSSDAAARRTTWCFEAWKGELVFENVPVLPRKN